MVKLLLEKGANCAAFDKRDRRAVHWAAYMGHADVVELLYRSGAELNARDKQVTNRQTDTALNSTPETNRLLTDTALSSTRGTNRLLTDRQTDTALSLTTGTNRLLSDKQIRR